MQEKNLSYRDLPATSRRHRRLREHLLVLAGLVCLSLTAGCDSGRSPTDPADGPLLPDFKCEEAVRCSLTCTDRTTGGRRPYQLLWQADEQAPSSVINPTFTWPFDDIELVRVRLIVTDDGGDGETAGPVERAFEICGAASTDSSTTDTGPADSGVGPTASESVHHGSTLGSIESPTGLYLLRRHHG